MDRATLAAKARKHWAQWLPQKTKDLKEAGELNETLLTAAANAQAKIQELMAQGYQEHEAEEVALAEYILLKPEVSESPEESREAAQREAAYQAMMKDNEATEDE